MNAKVLIACEESQTVCKAFRDRGFEATVTNTENSIRECLPRTEPKIVQKPFLELQKLWQSNGGVYYDY